MNTILVTGPSGYLGYHVIKLLNARGQRPRALVPAKSEETPALAALRGLDIEEVRGSLDDRASLEVACAGVDTVLQLDFKLVLGGGEAVERALYEANVVGTRNLLAAAAAAGASRVVVSSSALAVGLHREPVPLDESADWAVHGFDLAYARSRRQAEIEALARTQGDGPAVVVISPSFTLGPEDYVGAPANTLVRAMTRPWFRITAPIGFGVLDVRDYADGVLLAAERGRHGQRYVLSGENLFPHQLHREVAAVAGKQPPRRALSIQAWMVYPVVLAVELWGRIRGTPPLVTRSILALWGRHAWYDCRRAREELGWTPRPLAETLRDTLSWSEPH